MALVTTASIVQAAHEKGYAVPQINTNGACYDIVRCICEVAQELSAPVILGVYENNLDYRGFEYAGMVMRWFAQHTDVPVAIHLDHGQSLEACQKAIDAGFTSVMIDGSKSPFEDNLKLTQQVVELAQPQGVSVEAEIGQLQELNAQGLITEVKNFSNPDEVRIMSESGVDLLAVGIGNAHGFYKGQPNIRLDLLKEFAAVSRVPLVLHGTTGLADQTVERCVSMGMAKVNLGTLIRTRYVQYTADVIANEEHLNHPWRVQQAVKDKLKEDIRYIIRVTGCAGRAMEMVA